MSVPYRFDFGKHKGKTLDECDLIYIDWLIKNDVASSRPNLKAALEASAPSQPAISPACLTSMSSSNSQPTSSASSHNNQTITSPEQYIFPFGKYKGKTLGSLNDESYLHWLADQACEGTMTDTSLIKALTCMGYTISYNTSLAPLNASYRYPNLDSAPTVFGQG